MSFFSKSFPYSEKKEITLGVETLNYYQIISTDLNNQTIGFIPKLIDLVAKKFNLKVTITALPGAR